MGDYSKVILVGHVTRGVMVEGRVGFGVAVNMKFRNKDGEEKEEVTFVDCEIWGKMADAVGRYMKRGVHLLVEGRLKEDRWEKDGVKRSKMKVVVDRVEFMGVGRGEERRGRGFDGVKSAGVGRGAGDDDIPF